MIIVRRAGPGALSLQLWPLTSEVVFLYISIAWNESPRREVSLKPGLPTNNVPASVSTFGPNNYYYESKRMCVTKQIVFKLVKGQKRAHSIR